MAGKLDELGQWVREFAEYTGIMESKIRKVVDEMVASGKTTLDPQDVYSRLGGGELFAPMTPNAGRNAPRDVPAAAPEPTLDQRVAAKIGSNPGAREAIADRMDDLQGVNPQLAEQAASGNPEAVYEAYKLLATMPPGRPAMNTPTRQMELPLGPGAPEPDIRSLLPERGTGPRMGNRVLAHNALRDAWPLPYDADVEDLVASLDQLSPGQRRYIEALEKNDWLGFDHPSQAASAGLEADALGRWEMSPDLQAAREALIDNYPAGPSVGPRIRDGVPVKPPSPPPAPTIAEQFDSAVTGGPPRVSRWSTPQDQYNDMVHADLMRQPFIRRPMGPDVAAMDDAIDGPAPGMARPAPARPAGKDAPGIPWSAIGAGIAGGLAGSELSKPSGGKPAKKESTTADLVEESRPAPKVAVEEPEPSVAKGSPDYAAQARSLIARANDIQRAEGRQTPESIALIKEADRLYALAAEGRRSGTQPAIKPVDEQNAETSSIQRNSREQMSQNQGSDYRSQARRMMAELNSRSSQGNISQAEYSRMQAEIDRLFAMADQQDNAPRRASRPGMGRTQFPRAKEKPFQMIPNTRGLRPLAGPKTT
jgi:hypothetical protein